MTRYMENPDFHEVLANLEIGMPLEFVLRGKLLYKGTLLCVPRGTNRVQWLWEAHTLKVTGHFRVTRRSKIYNRFWLHMQQDVTCFVRGLRSM